MAAVLFLACLLTQPGSGMIFGTVTDAADSQAVAGAAVNLWRNDSCVALAADSLGGFRASVPAGRYTVIACASGGRVAGQHIEIPAGKDVRLDLRVGPPPPVPRIVPISEVIPTLPPIGGDIRLYQHGGCLADFETMLAITQVGESITIQSIGPRQAHRCREPIWGGPGTKVGLIPFAEFQMFWDSLHQLGFWDLKDQYSGKSRTRVEVSGYVSVSSMRFDGQRVTKRVDFSVPGACPREFGRVYDLIWGMARYAQSAPDSLKDTLAPRGHR
jgi:hypothetical protein